MFTKAEPLCSDFSWGVLSALLWNKLLTPLKWKALFPSSLWSGIGLPRRKNIREIRLVERGTVVQMTGEGHFHPACRHGWSGWQTLKFRRIFTIGDVFVSTLKWECEIRSTSTMEKETFSRAEEVTPLRETLRVPEGYRDLTETTFCS